MGDVVKFKPRESKKPDEELLPHQKFYADYEERIERVDSILNHVLVEAVTKFGLEEICVHDVYLLRESIMSAVMGGQQLYHPLQELAEIYGGFLGPVPPANTSPTTA